MRRVIEANIARLREMLKVEADPNEARNGSASARRRGREAQTGEAGR
jgi:hypothetical protein